METVPTLYTKRESERIHQGDIFETFEYKITTIKDDEVEELSITFPYVIVISQDCDLEQDFQLRKTPALQRNNEDKFLHNILVCPIFLASEVKLGNHLKEFGIKGELWGSDLWKPIKGNNNIRFHYLSEDTSFGLADLAIDFKRYFTVLRDTFYTPESRAKYKISIKDLFKEDLSFRFSQYLSRVPLPEIRAETPPVSAQLQN